MIDSAHLALFLGAAFLLAITPGPGIFYVAARTLAGGRGEGVASALGTAAGGLAQLVAASLGVSALLLASGRLFAALKLAGGLYLIWLGVRTALGARRDARAIAAGLAMPGTVGPRRAFREGIVVEATNPKTAAFFLAFIPQFVAPGRGHVALQFLALGLVSVALNTAADVAVAFAAAHVRHAVARRPGLIFRLRMASGAFMATLGVGLLLARRPAAP